MLSARVHRTLGIRLRLTARHVHVDLWLEKRAGREGSQKYFQRQQRIRDGTQRATAVKYGSGKREQQRATAEVAKLGRQRLWEEALARFAEVAEPDPILQAAALDACAKSFQLEHAWQIFREMPQKTPSAYGSLVALLLRRRRARDADDLLAEMRDSCMIPDESMYVGIIAAHAFIGNADEALQVFTDMQASGIRASPVSFSHAITACGRAGELERAKELLTQMESERILVELVHLNSVLGACQTLKDAVAAEEVWADMHRRGCQPDVISYTTFLGCLQGQEALTKAQSLMTEMRQSEIKPDVFVYNGLLSAAVKSRAVEPAHKILQEMRSEGIEPNRETDLRLRDLEDLEAQTRSVSTSSLPPLPVGWSEAVDPRTGHSYYWLESNPAGTTTWERPTAATPASADTAIGISKPPL